MNISRTNFTFCTGFFIDTFFMQVDEELKGDIYTDMMKAILKFEIRVK